MRELILEQNDVIRLNTGEELDFLSEASDNSNIITGLSNTGEIVRFNKNEIDCVKKFGLECVGGDNENFWMFYTGPGYKSSDINIANWARYEYPNIFQDMSDDEIIRKHLYWATDESCHYRGMYNGDTYVLFNSINKLPENMKFDAENAIK